MKMKSAALSLAAFVFAVVLPVQSHAEAYYLAGTDAPGKSALAGYGSVGNSTVLASIYYNAGLDKLGFMPTTVRAREAEGQVFRQHEEVRHAIQPLARKVVK